MSYPVNATLLARLRIENQMSMSQLARDARMSKSTVSRLEGGNARANRDTLQRLALTLGLPRWEMLVLDDLQPPPDDGLMILDLRTLRLQTHRGENAERIRSFSRTLALRGTTSERSWIGTRSDWEGSRSRILEGFLRYRPTAKRISLSLPAMELREDWTQQILESSEGLPCA